MSWNLIATALNVKILLGSVSHDPSHVEYVVDSPKEVLSALTFLIDVLSKPTNFLLLGTGGVAIAGAGLVYMQRRRPDGDVMVIQQLLRGYAEFVPALLRLAVGLPLIGAGVSGYFFSPAVSINMRLFLIVVGLLILAGVATRLVAVVGLVAYVVGLSQDSTLLLASEYVGAFLALVLLGAGRPSADQFLNQIALADTDSLPCCRLDPVHRVTAVFHEWTDEWKRYAPTMVRLALGFNFVYVGLTQKLLNPGLALAVVEKYNLTSVVPVDPGLWVVGAGLTEMALGFALLLGLFTRVVAFNVLGMLVTTLLGLPDDPVVAHITLFGLASALLITGSGALSLDEFVGESISAWKHRGRTNNVIRLDD